MEIYKGEGYATSKVILFIIKNSKVYKGSDIYKDPLYTIKDSKIYKGNDIYKDPLYTIKDSKIYKGNDIYKDPLYTIKDSKIYKGNDIYKTPLCTISNNTYTQIGKAIYKGSANNQSDVLYSINEPYISPEELAVTLLAFGLISSSNESSSNTSPSSFKSANNAEELGAVLANVLIDKVIKPGSLALFRKAKELFKK